MELYTDDLVNTLRNFLVSNETTVFGGLDRQNFGQVVTNQHVGLQKYVFVEIAVPTIDTGPLLANNDAELEIWSADYTVTIDLIDYAQIKANESRPYNEANDQFRIVCGRVCGLFMEKDFEISGQKATYKRPKDPNKKRIRVENNSALTREKASRALFAGLRGRLTMTLTGPCIGGT